MKEIVIENLSQIHTAAKEFIAAVGDNRVFAFEGKMGAGKTTFIKAICEELGVEDDIQSPTFAILNVYFSQSEGEIYHFDFYRLTSEYQALDIGVEENLYSGCWCFMEWAENIASLLPENCIKVSIEESINHHRVVKIEL